MRPRDCVCFLAGVLSVLLIIACVGCSAEPSEHEVSELELSERFVCETDGMAGLVSMRIITDTQNEHEYLFYKVGDAADLTALLPAEESTELDVPDINVGHTEAEVELLACAIYQEAGGDACCDNCRYRVGDVILNRMADERFPSTMEEVLTQEDQYGKYHKTGVVWPERAANPGEAHAVERAYETARALLEGQHSELYGEGYIWQARFPQGTDYFECCGTYFGR